MIKQTGCAVAAVLLCGIALPVWADDKEDVAAAMNMWRDYLAKGTTEDPGEILSLYAEDGVLWGTISSKRRDDPAAIRDYFVNAYKALPNLAVTFEDPYIRVYGDTAVNTGYYTFSYEKDGAMQSLPARYSFALVKRDGDWQIVDHHSSAMPQQPK
ncbi:MAG TPA: SgcJ/EcaC family oxidoreductase [Geminicoccaceae bacterium]